jgi:co-chaperonin GroES (HSP10)
VPADRLSDPADEAMVARARERFAADRRRLARRPVRRRGALPNLVVIGGLKCGTTSLHHYLNLHPQIAMSRPKELNFFVAELNWDLGGEWYASHFDPAAPVRGETSPHYTNLPRFDGVAERMRAVLGTRARLIYLVRHPIDRMLSHYLHNVGGGYEERPLDEALDDVESAYLARSCYAMQLEPYLAELGHERIAIVTREELKSVRMMADRVLVRRPEEDGERRSKGGLVIPPNAATVSKRGLWAEVAAVGPNVRAVETGDQVLLLPDTGIEVDSFATTKRRLFVECMKQLGWIRSP